MDQWVGKVAVVTGASSGIGAAIVKDLVKAKMITIGLARRLERMEELKSKVPKKLQKNLYAVRCDVTKEEDIINVFAWIETKFGGVDVLVNNAGIGKTTTLTEVANTAALREIMDTNVFGLIFCSREAVQSMTKRYVAGHIININSVVGHKVPFIPMVPSLNIYPATKYAVTALTEVYRQEFVKSDCKIKVTSISPGAVKTEIVPPELKNNLNVPFLEPEDISHAVLYCLGTPPHVQVHELTIKPVGEKM